MTLSENSKVLPTLKKCRFNKKTTVEKTETVTTTVITTTTTLLPEQHVISLYICVSDYGSLTISESESESESESTPTPTPTPTYTWFKIDPHHDTNGSRQLLKPLCQMPKSTPKNFQAVACGSQIYALGGCEADSDFWNDYYSDKVFVCDTKADSLIWKHCSSMELPRMFPSAAVVDGFIYALGCMNSKLDELDPWAEVFDPSSQSWTALPMPPKSLDSISFSSSVSAKGTGDVIILSHHLRDCIAHVFHCKTLSWSKIQLSGSNRYDPTSYLASSVAVGHMVYTFSDRRLYSWDLSQSEPCVEQVYGLEEEIKQIPKYAGLVVHLVDVGCGKLCLVWYGISAAVENAINIHCLKFWVGKRSGGTQLLAIVDRYDKYLANGSNIASCLTI